MPALPPTKSPTRTSPRKRSKDNRRLGEPQLQPESESIDNERTPRASHREGSVYAKLVERLGPQPPFAILKDASAASAGQGENPFAGRPKLAPSESSQSSTASQSPIKDTASTRDSSPTKLHKKRVLDEAGINILTGDENLSVLDKDAAALHKTIKICDHGMGVIPSFNRDNLEPQLRAEMEDLPPYAYRPSEPAKHFQERHELEQILEVVAETKRKNENPECEAAWNCDVHSTLLKIALKPYKDNLGQMNLTTASINPSSLPGKRAALPFKKIDFGIHLRPSPALASHITALHASDPTHRLFLNHTTYPALYQLPLALSIETKAGGGDIEEATRQLFTWATAHLVHLHRLLRHQVARGRTDLASEAPPTLPFVLVHGESWVVYFATTRAPAEEEVEGVAVQVAGRLKMGFTGDVLGAYKLIGALRAVFAWAVGRYGRWVERVLGAPGVEAVGGRGDGGEVL